MIGKLMKYEMRSMLKIFPLIWGAVLVLSTINGISIRMWGDDFEGIFLRVLSLLNILVFGAMVILAIIYIVERFRKGLLGSEGYLMFTLPVTENGLVLSKGISATLLILISSIVAMLSVSVMVIAAEVVTFSDIAEILKRVVAYSYWPQIRGMIASGVVLALLSGIAFIYKIYASLAVGQISNKKKTLMAVVIFIGFSIIESIAEATVSIRGLGITENMEFGYEAEFAYVAPIMNKLLWINIIIKSVEVVIYHIVTVFVLKKNLNLE